MRRLTGIERPLGALAALCVAAACSDGGSVPADTMSAEELARAIEKVGTVPTAEKAAQPPDPGLPLEPLRNGDVDPAFLDAAVCSFSSGPGVMMLATRDRLVARLGQRPIAFQAAGPVAPDGGYFAADEVRISIGLSAEAARLPQIGAGGAEAQISMPKQRRFSVRGSWACKLQRVPG